MQETNQDIFHTTKPLSRADQLSVTVTQNIGSMPSLIVHTIFFVGIFALQFFGFGFDQIMLILTTVVSLEAIYLSILIQMTVNRQAAGLAEVHRDVEEISEDIEDIQEEVKELGEEVEEISEDIEEDDKEDAREHHETTQKLEKIENTLHQLLRDLENIRTKQ
jgi:biopolymer transport protein ExbB/TolQ